jgi:DNA-binding LacI/PurR family transcriptional regulator
MRPSEKLVLMGDPEDGQFVRRMLDEKQPDAVICANDATAAALIRQLGAMKVRVPGDLKVAGIDDVGYASLLSPSLTTIRQPCSEIAEVALNTMKTRLQHPNLPPRTITLRGELVVRESTGK